MSQDKRQATKGKAAVPTTTAAAAAAAVDPLAEAIAALRAEVAALGERLGRLEAAALPAGASSSASGSAAVTTTTTARASEGASASASSPASRASASSASSSSDRLSEELVLVISAAIAAYLGKKAHVRQIRLLGSAAWAQQGRVTVQASHRLEIDR